MRLFLLSLILWIPLARAEQAPDPDKVWAALERSYRGSRTMKEWLKNTPGLSALERRLLSEDPTLAKAALPKVSVSPAKSGRFLLVVNGVRADLTRIREGFILVDGTRVDVKRSMLLPDLLSKMPGRGKKSTAWEFFPAAYAADGITNGCATKDLFTRYDIVSSPFGFLSHIWISAAALAVMRWTGDQFRDCDRQVSDLREILRKEKIAVKSLACGNDAWGADRKIEFWIPERDGAGAFKTRKFDLDYTNYFAKEEASPAEANASAKRPFDQRLYVFGEDHLREVRLLEDKGGDFYEACRTISADSKGRERDEFKAEKEKIEAFRKVFYYIGEHNTCTACRIAETRILSPRAPSYFPGASKPGQKAGDGAAAAEGTGGNAPAN